MCPFRLFLYISLLIVYISTVCYLFLLQFLFYSSILSYVI